MESSTAGHVADMGEARSPASAFDVFAQDWDAEHGPRSARAGEFAARLACLRGICGDIGRPRVLDLGCGTGATLLHLADAVERGTGIDLSPAMIARARSRTGFAHIGFQIADAVSFCRECGANFDLVLLVGVLAHLPDTDTALSAARQALAPGGRLVVISPNPWNPLFRMKLAIDGGRDAPPAHHLSPAALARLAERRGLEIAAAYGLPYAPWPRLAVLQRRVDPGSARSVPPALAGLARGAFALLFRSK